MSIFDRFKKTEKTQKPAAQKSAADAMPAKKTTRVTDDATRQKTVREEIEQAKGKPKRSVAPGVFAHKVLLKPIVSEKSAYLHSFNQYIFKIAPNANKVMVKKAIYEAYNVEPYEVKIINMHGKRVTRGKIRGVRSSYKKAIVTMPKGTTLPVYEGV